MEGDNVTLKSKLKNGTKIAALSLGITFLAAAPGTTAMAASGSDSAAQELVDALNVLKLDQVDYLYAYLQSIELSDKEVKQIKKNTKRANQIIRNTENIDALPNSAKVELLRLFMDNIKLLQLQAKIVDDSGNEINLVNYEPGTTGVKIQLLDKAGNLLATLDPTKADLNPQVLISKINALLAAVEALAELSDSGVFVPMPSAELPNTATELPTMIAIGGLLIVLGGAGLVPAVVYSRRENKAAEA
ncbi:cell wall anchor protein [Cytobacillus oceanisediminis]|uniref:Cell wall anchor protein n=1 Tax=Cytobacillus oceanisediminis TaxID=665099 RepID=A0A562J8M0_9BACI|nr:cell wall anchor protein [Cytobacillus oceanisediminis]TWH79244.1 hypothetical protein IQ19_04991 [Cytobacillus oceanisediminis]